MRPVPRAARSWASAAALWTVALAHLGTAPGCSDAHKGSSPQEAGVQSHPPDRVPTDSLPPGPTGSEGGGESVRDLPGPVASDPCRDEYRRSVAFVDLPDVVRRTRDRLAAAAAAGDWAAIDSASTRAGRDFRFSFGDPDLTPVEYWLRYEGGAFLSDLAFVLATEPATVGDSYVWPGWTAKEWGELDSRDREAIECAAGPDAVETMGSEGRYTWVRTAIDADGTWSYYVSGD